MVRLLFHAFCCSKTLFEVNFTAKTVSTVFSLVGLFISGFSLILLSSREKKLREASRGMCEILCRIYMLCKYLFGEIINLKRYLHKALIFNSIYHFKIFVFEFNVKKLLESQCSALNANIS